MQKFFSDMSSKINFNNNNNNDDDDDDDKGTRNAF